MTSSNYAKTFNLSNSTARRHLNILVDHNILKRKGSKRGAYYMLEDADNTPPAIAEPVPAKAGRGSKRGYPLHPLNLL